MNGHVLGVRARRGARPALRCARRVSQWIREAGAPGTVGAQAVDVGPSSSSARRAAEQPRRALELASRADALDPRQHEQLARALRAARARRCRTGRRAATVAGPTACAPRRAGRRVSSRTVAAVETRAATPLRGATAASPRRARTPSPPARTVSGARQLALFDARAARARARPAPRRAASAHAAPRGERQRARSATPGTYSAETAKAPANSAHQRDPRAPRAASARLTAPGPRPARRRRSRARGAVGHARREQQAVGEHGVGERLDVVGEHVVAALRAPPRRSPPQQHQRPRAGCAPSSRARVARGSARAARRRSGAATRWRGPAPSSPAPRRPRRRADRGELEHAVAGRVLGEHRRLVARPRGSRATGAP